MISMMRVFMQHTFHGKAKTIYDQLPHAAFGLRRTSKTAF
jgi:hypothetical protein